MKICIPTIDNQGLKAQVSEHFGGAPCFTVVDLESKVTETIDNQNQHHEHGQCNPLGAIADKGISAVVCIGIGRGAVERLNVGGIKVFLGTGATVEAVVDEYQKGGLRELNAEGACSGHGCH